MACIVLEPWPLAILSMCVSRLMATRCDGTTLKPIGALATVFVIVSFVVAVRVLSSNGCCVAGSTESTYVVGEELFGKFLLSVRNRRWDTTAVEGVDPVLSSICNANTMYLADW